MKNQDIELKNVVALLRRQTRVIFYTFGAVFALAISFLAAATPKYTATGLIHFDTGTKNLLDSSFSGSTTVGHENARVDSEVEILRSNSIGLAVVSSENLASDPEFGVHVGMSERFAQAIGIAHAGPVMKDLLVSRSLTNFQQATSIRRKGLTYLISVSVSSASPVRAAELANAVARTYIDQQVRTKVAASLAGRDVLQAQIDASRSELMQSERAFDSFLSDRIGSLDRIEGYGDIKSLNAKLLETEKALQYERAVRSDLLSHDMNESWESLALKLDDRSMLQIEKERRGLAEKLAGHPQKTEPVIDFSVRIEELETQLARTAELAANRLSGEIQTLETQEANQRAELRKTLLSSNLPADLLTDLYSLQKGAEIARSQYQDLLTRLQDIETQSGIQMADSRLVSPAIPPSLASFPNRNLVLLLALAVSTGLGVSFAFLNEYYIGGITTSDQLGEILQVSAETTLPFVSDPNEHRLTTADQIVDTPLSEYSESIRGLRAGIDQHFRSRKSDSALRPANVILVTSALPGEGKTSTALALARTYALAGKKALLLDADLRMPSVHRQVGLDPNVGLLDHLKDPESVTISGPFYARDPASPLMLLLGAGRSGMPTDQMLNSEAFEMLIKQAREVYDVIVIDTPPILPVVDARYIAHHAVAAVMIVSWAATSQNDVRAAAQPLRNSMRSDAIFMPVINMANSRGSGSRQNRYHAPYSAAI